MKTLKIPTVITLTGNVMMVKIGLIIKNKIPKPIAPKKIVQPPPTSDKPGTIIGRK